MRIGDCHIVRERNLILRGAAEVRVRPRSMDVLMYLADRAPAVVSIPDIVASLWRAEVSPANGLHKAIGELRKALDDDPVQPRYIETVAKRGYRLIAPMEVEDRVRLAVSEFQCDEPVVAFGRGVRNAALVQLGRSDKVSVVETPRNAAEKLAGISHVLQGSVVRDAERCRIVVVLSRLRDGTTLYSNRIDHDGPHSLAAQETIGQRIANAVGVHLDVAARARMYALGTRDAGAYLALLEAEHLYERANYQALVLAVARLREAISLDAGFLAAYERLAVSLRFLHWFVGSEDIVHELDELSLAASARAPGSETARIVAATRSCVGGQIAQQEAQLFAILNAGKAHAEAFRLYGRLLAGAGLWADADRYLQRAQSLLPNDIIWAREAGEVVLLRDGLEAMVEYRKSYLAHDPGDIGHLSGVVTGLASLGRAVQAEQTLAHMSRYDEMGLWTHSTDYFMRATLGRIQLGTPELAEFMADSRASDLAIGVVLFTLGDIEGGIRHWRRLGGNQSNNILSINRPSLETMFPAAVLADPRYGALLNEIGLGSEWSTFLAQRVGDLAAHTGLMPDAPLRN